MAQEKLDEDSRILFWQLSRETRVLPAMARDLIAHFGADWSRVNADDLVQAGLNPATAGRLSAPAERERAAAEMSLWEGEGRGWSVLGQTDYPERLSHCPDAPLALFWRGRAPQEHERNLAVVGTRRSTTYGLRMTRKVIEELSPLQPLIISGMAMGIDICAHLSALENGLCTWAVLAHGLDRIYPAVHKGEALRILNSGGSLLSEFPPGTPSHAFHFPRRNRIIAGLADAVWVVESGLKGGSMITASQALGYHRDVFALPGPADREQSAGCHQLIREQSAALGASARDIAEGLFWVPKIERPGAGGLFDVPPLSERIDQALPPNLQDLKEVLLWLTEQGPVHVEQLADKTRWSAPYLASRLLEAEWSGWLYARAGGFYEAVAPGYDP